MTIPTISTLPTAPARTDAPATFISRADAFLAALVTMQGELNTSIGAMNTDIAQANTDASTASTAATNASASAAAADAASNATLWVSGTSYSAGDVVYSPIDYLSYRANTATSGTTDPSVSADWTALVSGDPTLATQTKTYFSGESSTLTLSSALTSGVPVVSVTKEVAQTGVTNNTWDVDSTGENYTRVDSAYATTLTPSATGNGTFTLGTGSFAAGDVGKTIIGNGGVAVLTATDGSYITTTDFTDTSAIASGSWEMYAVVYNSTDGDLELSGTFVDKFDVSTAVYSQNFSVASQETFGAGIAFNTDGTKMFIVGWNGDDVNEYTLSTGFDVSTATYSQNFSVSAQETDPEGIAFNTDGTKMFIVGDAGDDVNEYTLSTAFDVSTATYSQNFSVSAQEASPRDITFNTDGTKMFIVGSDGDEVNEYTLGTGFDVSTASYSQNFSVSAQEVSPMGIAFNTQGTKMFILGSSGDDVNEYTLGTGFDVSTASYSQNFSVSAQDTQPMSIAFNTDGSKMFILGYTGDAVYEYNLGTMAAPTGYNAAHTTSSTDSTYWTDINSMTADESAGDGTVYYAVSTDDRTTWSIADNTDGIRDIVRNNAGTWEYNSNGTYGSETWTAASTNTELSALQEAMEGATSIIGFDVSTAAFVDSFSVSAQEINPRDVAFNTNGTKMFVVGTTGQDVNEYTLSTGFDVSTATYSQNFSVSAQEASPQGIAFNTDGTKMFIIGNSGVEVNEYTLGTGFDVSTATYSQNFSVSAQESTPLGIAFNTDGTKMFVVGSAGDDVNEYTLSTGFDVSTASYSQNFSVASQDTNVQDIAFNSDGTKMFIVGLSGVDVNEYTLSTGFDVSTATFVDSFSVSSEESNPCGISFNTDGTKMFIVGIIGDDVNEYTLGTTSYPNQMDKTQLDAVSDANHFTLGNDLDLAIVFNLTSGNTVPSSDGVSINYDANTLNEGAIIGTDYDFDFPATDKVRITALADNNLKVRVV